ncbi:hypothetical protein ACSQ67_004346 [Phaseolus vulgaris]
MYPYGASQVRCSSCQFVTEIGDLHGAIGDQMMVVQLNVEMLPNREHQNCVLLVHTRVYKSMGYMKKESLIQY